MKTSDAPGYHQFCFYAGVLAAVAMLDHVPPTGKLCEDIHPGIIPLSLTNVLFSEDILITDS